MASPISGTFRAVGSEEELAFLRREVDRLSLFHEVGKELASSLDITRILQTIMEKVSVLLNPDSWSLLLLDEDRNELWFEIAIGEGAEQLKEARIKVGEGIAGWVAEHGEPVLVTDVSQDHRFVDRFDEMTGVKTRSIVCVPIKGRQGTLGVIELVNMPTKESFHEEDLPNLTYLADFAAIALDNARYVARIHELTITDDCTALYNARHLSFVMDAEIYRSARYGYEFSIVFIDLDRFKQVNDTHGHLVGSKLLLKIADILKGHLRVIDTAFRYGGDEFVLVLPQTPKAEGLKAVRRLRDLLNGAVFFREEGLDLRVTASFGISAYPVDGKTRKDLLRVADEAMYLVKSGGRDGIGTVGERAPARP
jgi:diguanylate cyclase (GGDEF)-like protein